MRKILGDTTFNLRRIIWLSCQEATLLFRRLHSSSRLGLHFSHLGKRIRYYGKVRFGSPNRNISIGDNCVFGNNVYLSASPNATLRIGARCTVNDNCHIIAVADIEIGNDVLIAENVTIRDQNHNFDDIHRPISEQGFVAAPIVIENDVWIGCGSFIRSGITIGEGSIIGAHSVVLHNIPRWSIAVGQPARVVRDRRPVT